MNRITKRSEVLVGMWATSCCHLDLYQIESQDQIDLIFDNWEEGVSHDVWRTKKEALLDIREGWDEPDEIAMIDEMLKDLREVPQSTTNRL